MYKSLVVFLTLTIFIQPLTVEAVISDDVKQETSLPVSSLDEITSKELTMINEHDKKVEKEREEREITDRLPVPEDLSPYVHHIGVTHQGTNACGYHAAFNAFALQEAIKVNRNQMKRIGAEIIKLYTLTDLANIPINAHQLEISEILRLPKLKRLKNVYFMQVNHDKARDEQVRFVGVGSDARAWEDFYLSFLTGEEHQPVILIANLGGNAEGNKGGHWVSAVVTMSQFQPVVFYTNSTNALLSEDPHAVAFLRDLVKRFK